MHRIKLFQQKSATTIHHHSIGASIARELSRYTLKTILLERDDDVTQGATKGNSGIIHAGYDDKPGSVRSQFCWNGNQMFPQLDRELKFGYLQNGSLVIARSQTDYAHLKQLYERGQMNGVKNLRIIEKDELQRMEPFLSKDCIAGLYSPDAGTVTPYEFTIALGKFDLKLIFCEIKLNEWCADSDSPRSCGH